MAIKGKTKGRSARTVARGPKPVYTPVTRRPWQRKGFWYGVLAVLGVAAIAGLVYGFVNERNEQRDRDEIARMATAVRAYGGQLDALLSAAGQQSGTGFTAFPQIRAALGAIEQDPTAQDPAEVASSLEDLAATARTAAESLAAVDAAVIVRDEDLPQPFILYVLGSKEEIMSGLRLYEQAARLAALAATATGEEQTTLIARAKAVDTLAGEVFGRGYDDYIQAQSLAQTYQPRFPSGLSGVVPGLTGTTGLVPTGATGAPTAATGATGASASGVTG